MEKKRKHESSSSSNKRMTAEATRPTRRHGHRIDFMDFTLPAIAQTNVVTYQLPDISDSATIEHQGKNITLKKSMLLEIRILGRGNYAENVMLCEVENHPDLRMAVKKLSLFPSDKNPEDFSTQTDLRAIRQIGSGENQHVTKFFAAIRDTKSSCLIICMEACDASMDRFARQMHLMKLAQDLDIFLKRLMFHISDALQFLKTKNILHRDIKPSNILINQNPLCFKLCDFGICGFMTGSMCQTMMKGAQLYLAPERIDARRAPNGYGVRSDMWALGISVLEIANGVHPFDGLQAVGILQEIKQWQPPLSIPLSRELIDLIESLLKSDHADRPATYQEILSSPAMISLPTKVTEAEQTLVHQVIPKIPPVNGYED